MPDHIHIGEEPSEGDIFWTNVGKEITPEKSLQRLDTHGKYLFSTVAIVGTLLTGFGIFSPLKATTFLHPLLLVPVGLACVSLALAMMGITPKVRDVKRHDIISVRNYYDKLIRRRGYFIFGAGVTFALSLLSVAIVLVFFLRPTHVTPTLSIRLIGTGDKAVLSSKSEIEEMPRSGVAETEILGFKDTSEGPGQTVLFREISHADRAGKVTVSVELDQVQSYKKFVVQTKVKSGNKVLLEEKREITRNLDKNLKILNLHQAEGD